MTDSTKTVLVTGAMGQVGKRVAQILLGRGTTVIGLDLDTAGTQAVAAELTQAGRPGRFVPAFVDLTDADAVRAVMIEHQPGAVVHFAAVVSPPCYRNPELARRVNVDGTRHLVEAAKELTITPAFIEASSSAVYGARNPYRNAGRINPQTPVNPIDIYGEQKAAAEAIVADNGLPHAMLRLGGILSTDSLAMSTGPEYLLLMRATPRDNRVHMTDARDVAPGPVHQHRQDRRQRLDPRQQRRPDLPIGAPGPLANP